MTHLYIFDMLINDDPYSPFRGVVGNITPFVP
jgi:hypothetical protein